MEGGGMRDERVAKKDTKLIISVLTALAGVYLCSKVFIAWERQTPDIYSLGVLVLGVATILQVLMHIPED